MPRLTRRILWGTFLAFALAWVVVPSFVIKSLVREPQFRAHTEKIVGKFLRGNVRIHQLRSGAFNEVDLSGFELQWEKKDFSPYDLKIDRVLFRYHPLRFFFGANQAPSTIIFKEPELLLKRVAFPYDFFLNFDQGAKATKISDFRMEGGRLQMPVISGEEDLVLGQMNGSMSSAGSGIMQVDFRAQLSGLLEGKIRIYGRVNVKDRSHDLVLKLRGVKFAHNYFLPFESLDGEVRWTEGTISLDKLKTKFQGWAALLKGMIFYDDREVRANIEIFRNTEERLLGLQLLYEKSTGAFQLNIDALSVLQPRLKGVLRIEYPYAHFLQLVLESDASEGKGQIDLRNGDFDFHFEKLKQQFQIHSSAKTAGLNLKLNLEHAQVLGLDLVSRLNFNINPVTMFGRDRVWRFEGDFSSDYFILDSVPFNDFKGSFQISPAGFLLHQASWGGHFMAQGEGTLKSNKPVGHLEVVIHDYEIEGLQKMSPRSFIPYRFGGKLAGKINVEGVLEKPQVLAQLTIKDGLWDKIGYDRAFIQLEGTYPSLILKDSQILRGRTRLNLTGLIDLSLSNVMSGVAIETPEKIAVWRGMQLDADSKRSDLELSLDRYKTVSMGVRASSGPGAQEKSKSESDTSAEESYLAVGPKFKF